MNYCSYVYCPQQGDKRNLLKHSNNMWRGGGLCAECQMYKEKCICGYTIPPHVTVSWQMYTNLRFELNNYLPRLKVDINSRYKLLCRMTTSHITSNCEFGQKNKDCDHSLSDGYSHLAKPFFKFWHLFV